MIGSPEGPGGCQQTAEQAVPAPGERIRWRPTLPGGLPAHLAARDFADRLLVCTDLDGRRTPPAFREHRHPEEGKTTGRRPPDRAADQGADTSEQRGPGNGERAGGREAYGREMLLHDGAAQANHEPRATAQREVPFPTGRIEQRKRRASNSRPAECRESYWGMFGSFPPADGENAEQDEGQA